MRSTWLLPISINEVENDNAWGDVMRDLSPLVPLPHVGLIYQPWKIKMMIDVAGVIVKW
jgi:hypothetical protein